MKLDEWGIYLSRKAAKDLNGLALEQGPKTHLREDDQVTAINGVEGSGEELLTKLLRQDPEMPEIVLRIRRTRAELKCLRQLKPAYKQMQPCPANSTFFLLRSSTDGTPPIECNWVWRPSGLEQYDRTQPGIREGIQAQAARLFPDGVPGRVQRTASDVFAPG